METATGNSKFYKSCACIWIFCAAVLIVLLSGVDVYAGLQISEMSADTVTLTWTAPGDDGSTGMASSYDVRYSTSPITEDNWHLATQAVGEPTPGSPGEEEVFTISGLTEGEIYYFGIKACDEVPNWSGLSNIVFNCDLPIAPTLIGPSNGLTGLHQPLVLDWSNVSGANGYEIELDNNSDFSSPEIETSTISSYYTVTGLELETTYHWRIRAVSDCGSGTWSSVWYFTTESFIVGAQDISAPNDTVFASSKPTLEISNGVPESGNTYRFYVATDSLFMPATIIATSDDIEEKSDGTASWRVEARLSKGDTYFWRVSLNSDEYSEIFQFNVEPPNTHAYPSPFRLSEASHVTFTELPENSILVIATVSGEKIRQWETESGDPIQWDGTNEEGRKVASGVYLWYIVDTDIRGKLSMIR